MALLRYFQQRVGPSCRSQWSTLDGCTQFKHNDCQQKVKWALELFDGAGEKDLMPKLGQYKHYTGIEKAQIGKQAVENDVVATIRCFSKVFPNGSFKESGVRTWKKKYLQEITK